MIERAAFRTLQTWTGRGKALVLTGPRQTGKTTLIRALADTLNRKTLWLTGDDPEARALLDGIPLARMRLLIGDHEVVVVDEAQRFRNAGLTLKLITDHLPHVQLLVTGSSSLDLAAETKESLVGRKIELQLFPLSFAEMQAHHGYLQERSLMEHRMVYGYYPEVVQREPQEAQRVLRELADGLMYRDLLMLDQIKKPSLLVKLLQALALQLGSEVSYHELAQLTGADQATVERYIDLLEQAFVLFRLPSLSRNARNEIKKGRKIYFYDNGIRNAILQHFAPLALRADTGALWENFLLAERVKHNAYTGLFCNRYFWRTTGQQEVDYIEEYDGKLHAYEFKWQASKVVRPPETFMQAYPGSEFSVVTRDSFDTFAGL